MVPIDSFSASISSTLTNLSEMISHDNKLGNLSGLLAQHFMFGQHGKLGISWQVVVPLDIWLPENSLDLDQAPRLATLGCLLLETSDKESAIYLEALKRFAEGIERLKQRQNIFISPNSWALSSDVMVGISLGVFYAQQNLSLKNWLVEILKTGILRDDLPESLRLCYVYCVFLSGQTVELAPEIRTDSEPSELAFSIWLAKRFPSYLDAKNMKIDWLEHSQSSLLEGCLVNGLRTLDAWKAALIWSVLNEYVSSRSQLPRLDLINFILSNFDAAMERWKPDWKVKDEYDIQSILWLILRSSFMDLRYEESLPKLGRSGHRYDLGLPQLGLIVEVKYTRKSSDFQKILDEVSKDAVQITTQAVYQDIFVFVYDESCSVEQYAWAKSAIKQITRIKGCIIKSAPSTTRISVQLPKKSSRLRKNKAKTVLP